MFSDVLTAKMKTAKTIVKNSAWLICAEILSKTIIFFFTIIVARRLGVANFGKYGFFFLHSKFVIFFGDANVYYF